MANPYADMIIALNNVYPQTVTALDDFRKGVYNKAALDNAKQAVALYKVYANQRLALENGPSRTRTLLSFILTDLGEAPLYVERNVTLLRTYISAFDPTYVEPV